MKVFYLFPLFIVILSAAIVAQEPSEKRPDVAPAGDERPRLLELLGVSAEQKAEIQRLNQERRPKMQAAQQKLRESMRNLDMAIYGDAVNDSDFAARLREHQEAQAEIAKLRFEGELAMRKVLTPDQLVRFRQLRRQFNAARERMQKERRMQQRRPQDAPPMDSPRQPAVRPLRRPVQ